MDDLGAFLTREQAAKLAYECGQIAYQKQSLNSEDIL